MVRVINGREIAREIKEKIRIEIENYLNKGYRPPAIANIWFKGSGESELFLKLKERACKDVGIESKSIALPNNIGREKLRDILRKLSQDERLDGISIQAPFPRQISLDIFSDVDPYKDVEGLHPANLGKLLSGKEDIIPCTPQAILTILDKEGIDIEGKEVVIINHSMFIGKPLALLMLNRNATVSVCHAFTRDIKSFTKRADILVVAVGKPGIIGRDHVKEGATVIDVGITKEKEGIKGDVKFEEVREIASIITPVPGGVGPVTIACTLKNLIKLYRRGVNE